MLPVTPRPCLRSGVCVSNVPSSVRFSVSSCSVVALGVEPSATWLSAAFGQPALGYHDSQSGWQDSNLRLRAPKARGSAATLHLTRQSERPDLNRRSPAPRAGAIPRLRYVLILSDPCGSRTQPARLERPMTSPEVERAVGAHLLRSWSTGNARTPHAVGRAGNRIRVPSFSARC